jgi:hypothetical protein
MVVSLSREAQKELDALNRAIHLRVLQILE